MDTKALWKAYVREVTKNGRLIGAVGSTDAIDRYGEIVDQNSWQLDNFRKNPVMLWAHNLTFGEDRPPIGRIEPVEVRDGNLIFDAQMDMDDEFAAMIHGKYMKKVLNAFSVGFIPHRVERVSDESQPQLRAILKDNELLEISAVPVPANPQALMSLRQQNFMVRTWEQLIDRETKELDIDKVASEVLKKLQPQLGETVALAVSEAIKKSPNEIEPSKEPELVKTGGDERLVDVIRQTTKLFQGVLREVNASRK